MYCGGPLRLVQNQVVTSCLYCGNKYFLDADIPPAVVLEAGIDGAEAGEIITKELDRKEIDDAFKENASFERAVLYYVPFFELRGIKTGWGQSADGTPGYFSYNAFDSISAANELKDLDIGFIEPHVVENAVLNSRRVPFDAAAMRKQGVVLPPENMELLKSRDPVPRGAVESYYQLLYLPVWEISFTYRGILFKSYVSAVEGGVIRLKALRSHKQKILLSLLGLAALAIMARALLIGFFFTLVGLFFGIPVFLLLFPYLWELYAFREIYEKRGDTIDTYPINYTENSFIKNCRVLFGELLKGPSGSP